jgi:hemoglobin
MTTLYDKIGGDAGVRALVDRFYDLMETLPEAKELRALHPPDLSQSRDKLYMFLSGWLGGPPLFTEKFGHPRLRARHLPFVITDRERDQWMHCMRQAINETSLPLLSRQQLEGQLLQLAEHMRNA